MNVLKILLLGFLLALNPLGHEARAASPTGSFIGHALDSEAFIAIVTHGDKALAYICDGADVAEWFRGSVAEDGLLELRSSGGWTLKARLNVSGAAGWFVGESARPLSFRAVPQSGDAGLYRAEIDIDGVHYIGGWVIDQQGEQRGAVIGGGTPRAASNLDLLTLEAEVEGLGTLIAQLVTPAYVDALVTP